MTQRTQRFKMKVQRIINNIDNLKDNSKLNYINHLVKLFKIVEPKTITFNFLKDIENIKSIVNKESDSTAKMIYISAFRVLDRAKGFKTLSKKYKTLSFEVSARLNKRASDNLISDKRADRIVDNNTLLGYVNELKDNHTNNPNNVILKKYYMVGLMYIISKFTPRLEYADMKIIKDKTQDNNKDNFLLIQKSKWSVILNDYKTHGKYGKQIYQLENKVVKELKKLNVDNQTYLFEKTAGSPYKRKTFSALIKNAFKSINKQSGLNEIRIAKESALQSSPTYKGLSENEQEKLHIKFFLHGISIARTVYRKLDLINNNSDTEEI